MAVTRVLIANTVGFVALVVRAHASPPVSSVSNLIGGDNVSLDSVLKSAVAIQNNASIPRQNLVETISWLYPAKYDKERERLTSIPRASRALTVRGDQWQDWFMPLHADVPQGVPKWAQIALASGQISGELRNIGDALWITYGDEEARSMFASDAGYWAASEERKSYKLYGELRLLPSSLALRLHSFYQGQRVESRELNLPAIVALKAGSAEAVWVDSVARLRKLALWTSLKDELSLLKLYDWPRFTLSNTPDTRSRIAQQYAEWLRAFSDTLGENAIFSMSPVEALRIAEAAPYVPWSAQPEIKESHAQVLCRIKGVAWRPELNLNQSAKTQRQNGTASISNRGLMAQLIAEPDEFEPYASSVLALESLQRGVSIQPAIGISALRLLNLYQFRPGDHSPDAALQESGLLISFLLNGAKSPIRSNGDTWDYGPMVCYLHPPKSLRKVTLEERTETTISSVGGNTEYPFPTGTDQRSPYDFGANLAFMVWTNFREDDFDKLGSIEGGMADIPQMAIVLTFPTGIARRNIELAPLSEVKRMKISDMPGHIQADIRRGFDSAIAKLKKSTKPPIP